MVTPNESGQQFLDQDTETEPVREDSVALILGARATNVISHVELLIGRLERGHRYVSVKCNSADAAVSR